MLAGLLTFGALLAAVGIADHYRQKKLHKFNCFIVGLYHRGTITDNDYNSLWDMEPICKDYKITSINVLDRDLSVDHYYFGYCVNFEDQYHNEYSYSTCEGNNVKFVSHYRSQSEDHKEVDLYEKNKYVIAVLNKNDSKTTYYILARIPV